MKPTRHNPPPCTTPPPDLLGEARAACQRWAKADVVRCPPAIALVERLAARVKLLEATMAADGQAAAPELKGTAPLVVYFKDATDRAALIVAAQLANPNLVCSPVP